MKRLLFSIFILSILSSCTKDDTTSTPIDTTFKGFEKPANFPEPIYRFQYNPVTQAGFELGRKLFYDPQLSLDGSISCGTCHQQTYAFAQFDHPVSHGINDQLGTRNSPVIQNLAWSQFFFWDGGVFDMDLFPFGPIQNPVEMGEQVPHVLVKLRNDAKYPPLFKSAFGSDSITSTRMMHALSQFMSMLISNNSKYDKYIAGDAGAMNTSEVAGMSIFMQHCNRCHTAPLFTDQNFHNNGITRLSDKGRFNVTLQQQDVYKFKTPTLRNVEKSSPYFHDGRASTLESALNHYTSIIAGGSTVDTALVGGVQLSVEEKSNLLAFLKALTDDTFLRDTRFSEQ
jgi:cytochrome c peroxidase